MVNSLALSAAYAELKPVMDTAGKLITSGSSNDEVVDVMYKRCQADWRFSPSAAGIFNHLVDTENGEVGSAFSQTLFKLLNGYFKGQQSLSSHDNDCIFILQDYFHFSAMCTT